MSSVQALQKSHNWSEVRFAAGSCGEVRAAWALPDNVLPLWTDTEAASMAGKKRKTWHAGEHVRHTLGMFRYLPRYSKKEEGGRTKRPCVLYPAAETEEKMRGVSETAIDTQTEVQHCAWRAYLVFPA